MADRYNPASLRVQETVGGYDQLSVVTIVLPRGVCKNLGRGRALLNVVPRIGADPGFLYEISETPGDGTNRTFEMSRPIDRLIAGVVGGMLQAPGDCYVDGSGNMVLGGAIPTPGDANMVIKVGAIYVPRAT